MKQIQKGGEMGQHQLSRPIATPGFSAETNDETLPNQHAVEAIYREHIPAFVSAALIRLYDNVYCSLRRIAAYDSLEGVSTYVRQVDARVQAVILFRDRGKAIHVINQQIALKNDDIERFARKIFKEFERAQTISFYALDLDPQSGAFPSQHLAALEENVICFPARVEDYLGSLKGQFRKQLRVFREQLLRDAPGFEIRMFSGEEIQGDHARAILDLAAKRMQAKGKSDYTRAIDLPVLIGLLRACGHMAVGFIDGKVHGGAMWFSVGKRHFHQLAAHDSAYDRYMLGNQIWLAAIVHSLELGGSECWLMGGASAHKARFGARKKILHSYILYRSTWHAFLNFRQYSRMWAGSHAHRLKGGIQQVSARPGPTGFIARKAILAVQLLQSLTYPS